MKVNIIEPAVENISHLPLMERIERAGKVCYRSEKTIKEGSAEKFVERLAKLKHYSVLGHSQLMVMYTSEESVLLLQLMIPQHLKSHIQFIPVGGEDARTTLVAAGLDIWFQLFSDEENYPFDELKYFSEEFPVFEHLLTDEYLKEWMPLDGELLFSFEEPIDMQQTDVPYLLKETYVITTDRATAMQLRTHRFAAHSVMSQRYVNFKKYGFNYIMPDEVVEDKDFWLEMKQREADNYLEMLDKGYPPEIARGTLGSDIESTMVITASLWEWRHILRLRLDKTAQPAIRKVCGMIQEDLQYKYKNFNKLEGYFNV